MDVDLSVRNHMPFVKLDTVLCFVVVVVIIVVILFLFAYT